jgi:hypothetical protein
VSSGTVPAGLSLSAGGVLNGTPSSAGTSSFTVQVTDSASATATKTLSVTINDVPSAGAITITPADGATDIPVSAVITGRVGSGDIRTIFNTDTFTLMPNPATGDSRVGGSGALAGIACVTNGVVQGSFSYNRSHTRGRFTPNCPLDYNTAYVIDIAPGGGSSSAALQTFQFTTTVARTDSDHDGSDDGEDDHPYDGRRTSRWSPYGTGKILIDMMDSSASTVSRPATSGPTIGGAMAISDASARLNQTGKPEGVEFPDGMVSFLAEGIPLGSSATFQITFPSGIAAGSKVYQAEAGGFREVAGAVVSGDTVTITVKNTVAADGNVPVNPVGVAAPATSGTGTVDLSSASGGGCSVAGKSGSGGSNIDAFLILAGLGLTARGIRMRRRRG